MLVVPAPAAVAFREHPFAPDHVGKKGKADRPEEDEAEHHGRDPRALAALVEPHFRPRRPGSDGGHWEPPFVHVNVFHIIPDRNAAARRQGVM